MNGNRLEFSPCVAVAVLLAVLTLLPTSVFAIVNGQISDPAKSASIVLRGASGAGCSGTVIGPKTIITSANCVGDQSDTTVITPSQLHFSLRCSTNPLARTRVEADVALCLASSRIPVSVIARVSLDPTVPAGAKTVRISGYGCRKEGGIDRNYGETLSEGDASPVRITPAHDQVAWMETTGAALCLGDAGGGVYANSIVGQLLIGVASRGDFVSRSWAVMLSAPAISAWISDWPDPICGLKGDFGCSGKAAAASMIRLIAAESPMNADRQNTTSASPTSPSITPIYANPGETLRILVRRVCGAVPDSYAAEVRNLPTNSWIKALDTPLSATTSIQLLPCPPALLEPEAPSFNVNADKANWKAWNWFEFALQQRPNGWAYFVPPDDHKGAANFMDAFQRINQSINPKFDAYKLPDSSISIIRLPLAPPVEAPVTLAVARLGEAEIIPVFEIDPTANDCVPQNLPDAIYPVDVIGLETVLQHDREVAFTESQAVSALVTIADSGLDGAGTGIFKPSVIPGFGDQTYVQRMKPVKQAGDWFHGTAVASLVMGGPTFANAGAAFGIIRLNILQIYQLGQDGLFARPDIFGTMMRNNVSLVVNLSLKTAFTLDSLTPYIGGTALPLFVVAAGNDSQPLIPVPGKLPLLPAMLGGPSATNVLTVAAWDTAGNKIAGFSNWGPSVEIAAPGCFVPALITDGTTSAWIPTKFSGTSMATPIVSFTAALLRAYWVTPGGPVSASETKQRLLASSDLVKSAADKIADGRLVNPVKALSIYDDVIEELPESGHTQGKLDFGRVAFRQGQGQPLSDDEAIKAKCSDGRDSILIGSIRKITPNFLDIPGSKTTFVVYSWGGENKPMLRQQCSIDDVVITLRQRDTNTDLTFLLEQIRDYVPRAIR
jgi:subtilisin family serine protease